MSPTITQFVHFAFHVIWYYDIPEQSLFPGKEVVRHIYIHQKRLFSATVSPRDCKQTV
jgi:hypothetical protein